MTTLAAADLGPECLVLEVSEKAIVEAGGAAQSLAELRSRGVKIVMDDFGREYCSLAQLKRLPLDAVKLDGALLADIGGVSSDDAIMTGSVFIAHQLGLEVVAEGVETPAQLDFVRGLGCDAVQGFLPGRPAPADALDWWTTRGRPLAFALSDADRAERAPLAAEGAAAQPLVG